MNSAIVTKTEVTHKLGFMDVILSGPTSTYAIPDSMSPINIDIFLFQPNCKHFPIKGEIKK